MDVPTYHSPVMVKEVLGAIEPRGGGAYLDATVGAGGHSSAVLEASAPDGVLFGLDVDGAALEIARRSLARFAGRFFLFCANFSQVENLAAREGFPPFDGILMDLGVSSMQLEDPLRGFSFQEKGPLDMRMGGAVESSAADLVNNLREKELADLLYRYGEERRSRAIARAIVASRPIETTTRLAEVVTRAVGGRKGSKIHPATRTFQALRIAVNDELEVLEAALPRAVRLLAPGGRLAVISFHSLEDRIVKEFFRREARDCICPPTQPACTCGHRATLRTVTKKPITPAAEEIAANPGARSAKLRVSELL